MLFYTTLTTILFTAFSVNAQAKNFLGFENTELLLGLTLVEVDTAQVVGDHTGRVGGQIGFQFEYKFFDDLMIKQGAQFTQRSWYLEGCGSTSDTEFWYIDFPFALQENINSWLYGYFGFVFSLRATDHREIKSNSVCAVEDPRIVVIHGLFGLGFQISQKWRLQIYYSPPVSDTAVDTHLDTAGLQLSYKF